MIVKILLVLALATCSHGYRYRRTGRRVARVPCPQNMHRDPCASQPQQSCFHFVNRIDVERDPGAGCKSGCVCNTGFVLHAGMCIPTMDCETATGRVQEDGQQYEVPEDEDEDYGSGDQENFPRLRKRVFKRPPSSERRGNAFGRARRRSSSRSRFGADQGGTPSPSRNEGDIGTTMPPQAPYTDQPFGDPQTAQPSMNGDGYYDTGASIYNAVDDAGSPPDSTSLNGGENDDFYGQPEPQPMRGAGAGTYGGAEQTSFAAPEADTLSSDDGVPGVEYPSQVTNPPTSVDDYYDNYPNK